MNPENGDTCNIASIEVSGVSKRFGKVQALDEVTIEVQSGIVFALLGPNGSGKTTLVRILTTLLQPDTGTVRVGGHDVLADPAATRTVIGLAGQYPAVDENLTGKENLEMIGRLYHLQKQPAQERAWQLLKEFDLTDAAKRRVKTYSGGMRRRLDLAAALVSRPSILFLDEPTTGLDPRSRLGLWEVIKTHAKQCNSVLLTTQYLEEADRLADRIAIMENGRILRQGTPQELKDCCGGDTHVKMRLADRDTISRALGLLSGLSGDDSIHNNPDLGEISFPAPSGTVILPEVVRRFDSAGIELAELGLTQPTLDDVFLAITGHAVEEKAVSATNGNSEQMSE